MNNEEVAKHIWHDILQNSKIPWTWGLEFSTVKTIKCGTAFYVRATISGWVKIQQDVKGSFNIGFKPDGFGSYLTFDNLNSQEVISTIDRIVKEGVLLENIEPKEYKVAV